MEKLQQAIEKARAQRDDQIKERPKSTENTAPIPKSVQEAWDALPSIQLKSGILHRNRVVTLESGAISAPYDLLRTRMLRQAKLNGWRRIAFVSPHSSCGKTTAVTNLAFSLARQTSIRTLVFDFDLRRRGLTELFRQKPTYGMADVLEGRVTFADHALRYGKNVAFGFNFGSSETASEILQSPKTQGILDEIQSIYQPDLMLFDMPPLMASDDNFGFLHNVDAALLLVAAEKTTMTQIDVAERQVAELTNVMGIVLNKCRYTDGAYGHEYNSYY